MDRGGIVARDLQCWTKRTQRLQVQPRGYIRGLTWVATVSWRIRLNVGRSA
jgi:hypothetical protein